MDRRVKVIRIPKIELDKDDIEAIRSVLINVVVYASVALIVAIVAGTAVGIFILLARTIGGI